MKQILYIILCILLAAPLQAQEVRKAFVNMPDSILPILTKVNRADCIDFLDSNMKAEVKNRFDQPSEMTRLTSDYIAMQLSPKHTFELKMLPINDTTRIICTIQTVCSAACDSRINFYDATWKPLKAESFIILPTQSDFLSDTIPAQIADTLSTPWESLRTEADLLLMHASLADSTSTLTFRYTTPDYLNKESSKNFIPLLKNREITYKWQAGRFTPYQ